MTLDIKPIEFKIDPEFSKIIRPLSTKEYEKLKNSIKKRGYNWEEISILPDGTIIEGHHRYRACTELKIPVRYKTRNDFKDRAEIIQYIIDIHEKRRHFTEYELGELLFKSDELEKEREKAKQRQIELAGTRPNNVNNNNNKDTLGQICPKVDNTSNSSNSSNNNNIDYEYLKEKGRAIENLAKKNGFSLTQLKKIKKIIEKASEEQKKKLREGRIKIHKVWSKIDRDEKNEKLLNAALTLLLPNKEKCDLRLGDFREKCKDIKDNSVSLIVTDPPYADTPENILLYEELAKLALRVLKPGDAIVFLVGGVILDEVIVKFHQLKKSGLRWWWPIVMEHEGSSDPVFSRSIKPEQKIFLGYFKEGGKEKTKPDGLLRLMPDLFKSSKPDKTTHEWAQHEGDARYFIEKLTVENDIVLDPFMGSGAFGIAAWKLRRQFIGCEKDKEKFEKAEANIKVAFGEGKNDSTTTNKDQKGGI